MLKIVHKMRLHWLYKPRKKIIVKKCWKKEGALLRPRSSTAFTVCFYRYRLSVGTSPARMPAKNWFFNTIFSACYFLKVYLHYFSKIKSQKESQNSRIQGLSYYFCMMIEGSGSLSRAGSGSIPLTSGSGRTKNTWIRNTGGQRPVATSHWASPK